MTYDDKDAIRGALHYLREYAPIHLDIDRKLETWTTLSTDAEREAQIELVEGAVRALDELALKFITWKIVISDCAKLTKEGV